MESKFSLKAVSSELDPLTRVETMQKDQLNGPLQTVVIDNFRSKETTLDLNGLILQNMMMDHTELEDLIENGKSGTNLEQSITAELLEIALSKQLSSRQLLNNGPRQLIQFPLAALLKNVVNQFKRIAKILQLK